MEDELRGISDNLQEVSKYLMSKLEKDSKIALFELIILEQTLFFW
jgi:hypothetical protein